MTIEIIIVLVLFCIAAVLLATELVPPEVTALCIIILLTGTGIMTAEEAFQGFANESIVVLTCVMILSRRLLDSGAMRGLSARMVGQRGTGPSKITARLMASTAGLSTIFSNTSATAVMMPVAIEAARKSKINPGRFLMPMAFASMMGGSATLIGTSTNLAMNSAVTRMGLEPFALFEFFIVGFLVSIAGIATVTLLGRLFVGQKPNAIDAMERKELFLAVVTVPPESKAVGATTSELALGDIGVIPVAIETDTGRASPHPRRKFREGDQIIVRATGEGLERLLGDGRFQVDGATEDAPVEVACEAILLPGAQWIGMSVSSMRNRISPDVSVIGIRRAGYERIARIGLMRLRAGDILRFVGSREGTDRIDADVNLYLLGDLEPLTPTRREGWYTLTALIAAIVVATAGLLPLSIALLSAVIGLVLAGRFSLRDGFAMVSWRILILIGGMSSFGVAMLQTGAAGLLAGLILSHVAPLGLISVLIVLSLLTVILTQPLTNAAAALTMLPIAIAIADGLGIDPRPLAIIVTLSASLSFIAPLEPALLLVYGKGNYKLREIIIAGIPLTLVSVVTVLLVVPWIWPF